MPARPPARPQLGLPVRVIRRQKDSSAPWGYVLVFHGLYDVVRQGWLVVFVWMTLGLESWLMSLAGVQSVDKLWKGRGTGRVLGRK